MTHRVTGRASRGYRRAELVAIAAVLALCVLLTSSAAADAKTRIVRYQPFTAAGDLKRSVRVETTRGGADCWTGSFTGRTGAWRCMVGNRIYDPCFESPDGTVAVCPGMPGGRATVLRQPQYAREHANDGPGMIWAVRAGRYRCVAASGARSVVNGRAPMYFCGKMAVWGKLDDRGGSMRALVGTSENPAGWRWVRVQTAWR